MPTSLSTADLRDLGADVLARSVFTARGINAIFTSKIAEVVNEIAAGNLSDSQARAALYQLLQDIGYTPEGGFPDVPEGTVPPAIRGSLQDLSSFRRLDLIIRTQRAMHEGAGQLWRAMQPESLASFPAFELIRVSPVEDSRDWPGRWVIAGFDAPDPKYGNAHKIVGEPTGMIGLVGDPRWGELGSYENFPDALGVDHSPFAFNSAMGMQLVTMERCIREGIQGPNGESPEEWITSGEGITLQGRLPKLPRPRLSLAGVKPELVEKFQRETFAEPVPGTASTVDFSDLLTASLKRADEAYRKEDAP